ncbi:hypothetical protein [Maribacter sp. MAR_2009_72]|uniref:hypothetical protein n=1 Tax=Maribacter sp. MAR_2009_72 TaxID=1250050 RepID=UPI0011994DA1|nr:hypothetical protein [Maribacter sp. MAR_2009_72]TVZ15148.1 hypothetical protein JM81_1373 [Maribacter sp. MAR_2009_72]
MKRVFLLAVLGLVLLFSCTDRDDNIDMVNIRIQNSTPFFFNEVRVTQRDTVYENIAPDEFSSYLEYDTAYQTTALTILTDSTSYNYFPEEVPSDTLPVGFYTYQITIDEEENIALTFRIDE